MERLIPEQTIRELADLQLVLFRNREGFFGLQEAKSTIAKCSPGCYPMEQCPVTFSNMSQMHGYVCDPKTMYFENSSKAFTRAEVICPRPYHASRIPMFMEGVNKFCPKSKSILPKQKEDSSFEFRDIILNKDDQYGDLDGGAQMVFFCGSPPVRSHNPVVRDEQFTKQTKSIFSPLPVNSFGVGKSCARVDRASPICGSFSGNPKVRIEGFTCKKSDSRSAVPALA